MARLITKSSKKSELPLIKLSIIAENEESEEKHVESSQISSNKSIANNKASKKLKKKSKKTNKNKRNATSQIDECKDSTQTLQSAGLTEETKDDSKEEKTGLDSVFNSINNDIINLFFGVNAIKPNFTFSDRCSNQARSRLNNQIFGTIATKNDEYIELIKGAIGNYERIRAIRANINDRLLSNTSKYNDILCGMFNSIKTSQDSANLMKIISKYILNLYNYKDYRVSLTDKNGQLKGRAKQLLCTIFKKYSNDHGQYAQIRLMSKIDFCNYMVDAKGITNFDAKMVNYDLRYYSNDSYSYYNSKYLDLNGFLAYYEECGDRIAWQHLDRLGDKSAKKLHKSLVAEMTEKKEEKEDNYHPVLTIYTIANIMSSLIVDLWQTSLNNNGIVSIDVCNKILETFFRYHHLLLAFYHLNKLELQPIIQDQLNLFFTMPDSRNKRNIPDFGLFLIYLPLWEASSKKNSGETVDWNTIGIELLDEVFTRDIKHVLKQAPGLINNKNNTNKGRTLRIMKTWKNTFESRILFMIEYYFLKHVCQLFGASSGSGNKIVTPQSKYNEYNECKGIYSNDNDNDNMAGASKLQLFINNCFNKCSNWNEFFDIIEIQCPSNQELANWLLNCMIKTQFRKY